MASHTPANINMDAMRCGGSRLTSPSCGEYWPRPKADLRHCRMRIGHVPYATHFGLMLDIAPLPRRANSRHVAPRLLDNSIVREYLTVRNFLT